MSNIKVGLIRCDTHAAYFAGLMDRFDLELLKNPSQCGGAGRYSWQGGKVYYLLFKDVHHLDRMTVPSVPGFTITKVWDPEYEDAVCFSRVFKVEKVCSNFEEVSDDVDLVFIAECNGEGKDHLRLATPGLRKGVPTFVDKPFAYEIADAVKLVRLAHENKVPLLSLSILREAPQGARFRCRLGEVGRLRLGSILLGSGSLAGEIHTLSLAQSVFGAGVKSVECLGEYDVLHYGDKENNRSFDVLINGPGWPGKSPEWTWKTGFHAVAYGHEGCICSECIGDYEEPEGAVRILKKIKKMVQTRKPVVPYNEMLELIALATATRKAEREKRTVMISEVWKRKNSFDSH